MIRLKTKPTFAWLRLQPLTATHLPSRGFLQPETVQTLQDLHLRTELVSVHTGHVANKREGIGYL